MMKGDLLYSFFDIIDILPITLKSIYTTTYPSRASLQDWMSIVMAERVRSFMLDLAFGNTIDQCRLNAALTDCLGGENLGPNEPNPFCIFSEEKIAHMNLWEEMKNLVEEEFDGSFTEADYPYQYLKSK